MSSQEKDNVKLFRKMGYTFKSLVAHYLQEQNFQAMLKERLYFIDKAHGKVCICSAFSVEKNGKDGTNVVPAYWCMIKDKHDKPCMGGKLTDAEQAKVLELREELERYLKELD